ncbi:MAG: hypothetical protein J5I98_08740 [Phaeodactylibacter sp.]|nr:hypothetical protein [Phaeodactylibacter sp.]
MKQRLRQLIAKGKAQKAIQDLLHLTQRLDEGELHEEVVMLSARYEQHARSERLGIATKEENKVSLAAINNALLGIINRLPESKQMGIEEDDAFDNVIDEISHSNRKWRPWVAVALVLFGVLAAMAHLAGYGLNSLFKNDDVDSFSVTILVHGKTGKDDRILRNQGEVVLDFGTAREEASINDNGEATFKELPAGYIGKKARISIDHPQPYFPVDRDAEYILERRKAIYLEVELTGTDIIRGRVLDHETEKPLDSVRVSYQDIAAFTNAYGWFELNIPEDKQAKFIRVNFYKGGYKMQDIDSIAPHTQQEMGILLRKE